MLLLRSSIVVIFALFVGACSSASTPSEDVFLRRAPANGSSDDAKGSSSSNQGTPTQDDDPPPANDTPPPTTDAGSPAPPAPPTPEPGSCGAPKCTGIGGVCGCSGQDQGDKTLMGCSDGVCTCAGKTFPDDGACGVLADKAALASLFAVNCNCQ